MVQKLVKNFALHNPYVLEDKFPKEIKEIILGRCKYMTLQSSAH